MYKIWEGLLKSLDEARRIEDWEYAHEILNTLTLVAKDKGDKVQIKSIKENMPYER